MCPFKYDLPHEMSIEQALQFHKEKMGYTKGVSYFVPAEKIWLVFVFGKFLKINQEEPEAKINIGGVSLEVK